jgi:hypothetical protein
MSEFNQGDVEQILTLGKSLEEVASQVQALREALVPLRLSRPCDKNDGIRVLGEAEQYRYRRIFETEQSQRNITKFVAASGSATRMFQFLSPSAGSAGKNGPWVAPCETRRDKGHEHVCPSKAFFEKLEKFAFFEELSAVLASKGQCLEDLLNQERYELVAQFLLGPEGLAYADLPKALISFHRNRLGSRTALEEHLYEASNYIRGNHGIARVHFTISPNHIQLVRKALPNIQRRVSKSGLDVQVDFSIQDSSTDSVALELDNRLARKSDGRLVFRPGGHGALIRNLDAMRGDVVFIRTVDNILPEDQHKNVARNKMVLGGFLISLQRGVFRHLQKLCSERLSAEAIRAAEDFGRSCLFLKAPEDLKHRSIQLQKEYWAGHLNRPLRVCGVVPRKEEPGGAPFWVDGPGGTETLQIVEEAEVDLKSPDQRYIWESSQYFNPVDIVCGVRDFQGRSFNLFDFRDPGTTFVTTKSWEGRRLQSLELPGLWNGAMAQWNTVFVEVPKSTFRPVKTVLDLLTPVWSG